MFSENCSWYFAAYARDVAALWARMTSTIAPTVANRVGRSDQPTSGRPTEGRPPGTGPSIVTPSAARSQYQLTKIAPTTAISAPGMRRLIFRQPRMTASTPSETRSVVVFVSPMFDSVVTNLSTVPPDPDDTPSMPLTWPIATWMPTPVRKPIRTLRDRKSARNPSRMIRATTSTTPVMIATPEASATYSAEPAAASGASPAARMAAVAESAPTTR